MSFKRLSIINSRPPKRWSTVERLVTADGDLKLFDVYHDDPANSHFMVFPNRQKLFPSGFTLVARVLARDEEHAYELTNSIDNPWAVTEDAHIQWKRSIKERSTSMGDVIAQCKGGENTVTYVRRVMVDVVGMKEF